jgi:hypothetical protein
MKFKSGDMLPTTVMETVTGEAINLPGMAHGHFALRFAGGGPLGLPADFPIAPSGRINAVKYGIDAYDQWSVDELLTLAKSVAAEAL